MHTARQTVLLLRIQMAMPFRAATQEANRPRLGLLIVCDQRAGVQQRRRDTRRLDIQQAQHARGIAPEPMIALANMRQGVSGHRVRQLGGGGNQPFEPLPPTGQLCRLIQGCAIASGVQQSGSEGFESAQGILHRGLGVSDLGIAELLCALPCLAHDPVVRLDHRIGKRRTPCDRADRDDGQAAITADVAQSIGKVAFALTLETGHPMGWNTREDVRRQVQILQEFQPIEQAGDVG